MAKYYSSFILFSLLFFLIFFEKNNDFYNEFSKIPIFSDGRVKSLDSFSKSIFLDLELNFDSSLYSDLFFDFENFSKKNVFKLNKNLIRNLSLIEKNYYSFNDILYSIKKNYNLIKLLQKTDYDSRTDDQNSLLELYYKVFYILKIKDCFVGKIDINDNFYLIFSKNYKWVTLDFFFNYDILERNYILNLIKSMHLHYKIGNAYMWKQDCSDLYLFNLNGINGLNIIKLYLDIIYSSTNLIYCSFLFYFVAFFFNLIRLFDKFKIFFFIYAIFFNVAEIVIRILISERPPVTNLYESIVFVNLIISLVFLFLYFKFKLNFNFVFFILVFQYVDYKYSINGMNIKNLVPVLNTNFWLICHVITITIGYSLCLISGLCAHLYLYLVFIKRKILLYKFFSYIYILIIFSLFFIVFGTILGGVWADQSWGRFWGWDPKENGAMLVSLWLILIIHLKQINFFNNLFFIFSVIINNIMVFLSWFGVNLLNVGLHSYGFTNNVGFGLLFFTLFEIFYIFLFYLLINNVNKIKFDNL